MNRRVLAALLTLADVHEAKEGGRRDLDEAYTHHGLSLRGLQHRELVLYEDLARALCAEGETITSDPVGAETLEATRARGVAR